MSQLSLESRNLRFWSLKSLKSRKNDSKFIHKSLFCPSILWKNKINKKYIFSKPKLLFFQKNFQKFSPSLRSGHNLFHAFILFCAKNQQKFTTHLQNGPPSLPKSIHTVKIALNSLLFLQLDIYSNYVVGKIRHGRAEALRRMKNNQKMQLFQVTIAIISKIFLKLSPSLRSGHIMLYLFKILSTFD